MFTILLNQDFEDQGHHTEQLGGEYETAAEAVAAAIGFFGKVEMNPRYDSIDVWQDGAYFGTAYEDGTFGVFSLHSHGCTPTNEAEAGWRWHQLDMGDTPINVNSRQFDALLLQQLDDVPF